MLGLFAVRILEHLVELQRRHDHPHGGHHRFELVEIDGAALVEVKGVKGLERCAELADQRGLSLNQLVAEVDEGRSGNLSSALRVFALRETCG